MLSSLEVLHKQHPERIRLSGIDCPEKAQAYGNNAKHAASALVFGKEVTIQTHGKDKYKRTLADVILPDGMSLNQELVKHGWCWWYRKYAPGDTVLEGLEKEARESWKWLWADPQPVPPWEWRKRKQGGKEDGGPLPFHPALFATSPFRAVSDHRILGVESRPPFTGMRRRKNRY